MENIRELTADVLLEILERDKFSHLVIRDVLQKYDYLDGRDKAFLKRVAEGTLERRLQLDYVLNQFSKVSTEKMKPFIRTLLRMSVYQILYMDNVPDSAVCNEAVKLCKKRSFHNLQGFVNGVLRNIARNKEKIEYPDRGSKTVEGLSVCYSMPQWLVEKFLAELGREKTERMLEAFLKPQAVSLRFCGQLTKEEKVGLIKQWQKEKITVREHAYLPYACQIENVEGISKLAGFMEGKVTVQDVSSMLVCEVADIKPGNRVIDVCAAPGGKAVHVAEKLQGTGQVSARDLTEYKVSLIQENIDRMQLANCEAFVWDVCIERQEDVETADVVLADLPCSGLGIMGKKKDIRYHVTRQSLEELSALQKKILSCVQRYVKPGGVLIYSTCTINPAENEENVDWFLSQYPFETESMEAYLPKPLKEAGKSGMLQLIPGIHETDGFFIARLRRKD